MSEKNLTELKAAIETMRRDACASLRPFSVKAWHLPQIKRVGEWLEGLENRVNPTVTAQELLAKLLRGEALSRIEIRDIPSVLYDESCSMELFHKALRMLRLDRASQCRNLLFSYLWHYDAGEKTRTIAKALLKALRRSPPSIYRRFLYHAAQQPQLFFGSKCTSLMAELLYRNESAAEWMKSLAIPASLEGGSFFFHILQIYYEEKSFSLEKKFAIFRELKDGSAYRKLFPIIASCLIPKVDEAESSLQSAWKKELLDDFYHRWGNPHFAAHRMNWQPVSENARKIFLRWVAERNMNLFFEIIEDTAVDPAWPYRRDFWQRYLPYIGNTRVFFGKEAIGYARRLKTDEDWLSFGELSGGVAKHSVFVVELDRYVFIEWSHNGTLRVWETDCLAEHFEDIFNEKYLAKSDITEKDFCPLKEWRHAGKENHRWQEKVARWIDENCILN